MVASSPFLLLDSCCCWSPLSIFSMLLSSTEADVAEVELGDDTWRGRGGEATADGGCGDDCLLLLVGGGGAGSSRDAGLLRGRDGDTCGGDLLGGDPHALRLLLCEPGVTVSNAEPVGDSAPTDTPPWKGAPWPLPDGLVTGGGTGSW